MHREAGIERTVAWVEKFSLSYNATDFNFYRVPRLSIARFVYDGHSARLFSTVVFLLSSVWP